MARVRRFWSLVPVVVLVLAATLISAPGVAAGQGAVKVIVNFRGAHPLRPQQQAGTIHNAGGSVTHRFGLINSVAATIPAGQLKALRAQPNVKSVELDATIKAFDTTPNAELDAAWGVKRIGAGDVHNAGNTGQGVRVGIIDTGIDYTHPDLDSVYAGGYDFFNNDNDPFDDNGHGTHVAGILAGERNDPAQGVVGVAPGAAVYAYKVLGADGSGDYSGLIAALERATAVDNVQVINMSLGGPDASDALAAEIAAVYSRGVVLVAASGNVNPSNFQQLLYGCPVAYPAAYPEVMSTTFTNPNDALTGYSCTGPQVDFASPGDQINSTVPTGLCMFCAPSGYRGDLSGTSMASPHLAGVAALVLAHGIANWGDQTTLADDVKAHLCADASVAFGVNSTPIPRSDPRYKQYFGCGVVNAARALLTDPPAEPGTPEPPPAPNHAPVAGADSASTPQDTAVVVNVLANDSDPDGDALTLSMGSQPAHGTAALSGNGIRYTPAAGYQGSDSFSYSISDGRGGTATATVNVTVTAPTNTMHVGDLDAFPTKTTTSWSSRVRITVHSPTHAALWLVTVKAQWDNGQTQSCTTGLTGYCDMTLTGTSLTIASRTFTITSLTMSGRTYIASANHDPDTDSNGTAITINRP